MTGTHAADRASLDGLQQLEGVGRARTSAISPWIVRGASARCGRWCLPATETHRIPQTSLDCLLVLISLLHIERRHSHKVTSVRSEPELREVAREVLAADSALRWDCTAWVGPKPVLTLKLDGHDLRFETVFRLNPSARDVDRIAEKPHPHPPLLIAPSLSDVLVRHCRDRGIPCADLNGRVWVRIGPVLIDRSPSGGRRYRPLLTPPDPFQPKSSRLVRALLSHPERGWTQRELIARTGLSPGLVSRLTRHLISQGWVEEVDRVLSLQRPDSLLDAWATEDDWTRRTTLRQYSLLETDPERVARRLIQGLAARQPVVFTQWFAANLRHPYTPPPVVSAYVPTLPTGEELNSLGGRPVGDGGTLWLIVPNDEGVFRETQQVGEFVLTCDAQVYLDLLQVGLRGPDQARALRDWSGFRGVHP